MTPKMYSQDELSFVPQALDPKTLKRLSESDEFFFRLVFYPLIDEEIFLPMYTDEDDSKEDGDSQNKEYHRPSTSPKLLYMENFLRGYYGCSEPELVNRMHFDLRAQFAANIVGLGEKMPGMDRLLEKFQLRCERYAEKTGINPVDQINDKITLYACALTGQNLGLLRSGSIEVSDHCARYSREELVQKAIEMCVLEIAENGSDEQKSRILYGSICPRTEEEKRTGRLAKYLDPRFTLNNFSYIWSAKKSEKRTLLCEDATELLTILDLDPALLNNSTIVLGMRVLNEQTRSNLNQSREFIPMGDDSMTSSMLQTFQDVDSTYRKKVGQHYGYVLNVMETVNKLTHMAIGCCLYPNTENDADMEKELYNQLPSFRERLNAIYAAHPTLVSGDPETCQKVVSSVYETIQRDFVQDGTILYDMCKVGTYPIEALRAQELKMFDDLNSFYTRLDNYVPDSPHDSGPHDDGDGTHHDSEHHDDGHAHGDDAHPDACVNSEKHGGTILGKGVVYDPDEHRMTISLSDGSVLNGILPNNSQPCSNAVTNWACYGETPISWNDPRFADLTPTSRRNFYLNKIAEQHNFKLPTGVKISVADGAYPAAEGAAKAVGYEQFTVNSLGNKARAILPLFQQENGKYTFCPLGKPIRKQSEQANGVICLWLEKGCCENCPCRQDCGCKLQKESAKIQFNPNSIPSLVNEAKTLTNEYQKLAWIRNGSEAFMNYLRNVLHCDFWPIGIKDKRWRAKSAICGSNVRNCFLFTKKKTRVHHNSVYDIVGDAGTAA